MRAVILAAGLGARMRPLTDTTPKPLLPAGGQPLVAWHLQRLAAAGVRDVVINTSWLADRFPATLGDGARWGLRIAYSYEGDTPLETGGGLLHALPLLGDDDAFLAINGDIWTDVALAPLLRPPRGDAHLVLVDNPAHHAQGDFTLHADGRVDDAGTALEARRDAARGDAPDVDAQQGAGSRAARRLTFAGIGTYRRSLFDGWREAVARDPTADAAGAGSTPPRFRLPPLLRAAMARGRASGQHHRGAWTDVGTPARLAELDAALHSAQATR